MQKAAQDLFPVTHYWLCWDWKNNIGEIALYSEEFELMDGMVMRQKFNDPRVFGVIVDMLRNEKPLYWYHPRRMLYTGSSRAEREPVGPGDEEWTGPEEVGAPPSPAPGVPPGL